MFESVQGRSVIVTGASRGIGKGIARVFARAGARVLLVARGEEGLREAAEDVGREGGAVAWVAADVASREGVGQMVAAAEERHGGVDVLCANAGIFPEASLRDITPEQIDEVLNVNLKGGMLAAQACLPALERSGRGRVILTSSITGPITGYPGWCHYGASKAAQLGFMRTAAIELAPAGITVNAILPGNVLTEGLVELGQEYIDGMARTIPLKRLGTVEEVGYAALFLASEEAGFITGQTLVVDGGQVLPESLAE